MKVNFDELYLTQLQAKTPGYVIGLSDQQWLNLGASEADLKKLKSIHLNPKRMTHIKNQLTTMKRNFQAGLVIPGGHDWLILHDQKLKQFLSDFDATERKAAELIESFTENYYDILEDFQDELTTQFKKLKLFVGEPDPQNDLVLAYLDQYYPSSEMIYNWGFSLFFPFNIGGYLTNIPAKGKKTIEGIITLAGESFASTALELCSDWLKLSDDLTKPVPDEAKKNEQQQLLVDRLGSIAVYATAFKTIISKDLHDLIFMCLGEVRLNKNKIRRQWSKLLLHSGLGNIAERNMAYWVIAGSDNECSITSPKSRLNRKHWEQDSTIEEVHNKLKSFI